MKSLFWSLRRVFATQKWFSVINILGLAVAITSCLAIYKVIEFESGYDDFQPNPQRIYRFVTEVLKGGHLQYTAAVPGPFPVAFRNDFPRSGTVATLFAIPTADIKVAVDGRAVKNAEKLFTEKTSVFFTEAEIFDILYSKWLAGDKSVLSEPGMVVLDRSHAMKYFDKWENAVGQTLRLDDKVTLKIAGVIEDYPLNSDFPLKILVSFPTLRQYPEYLRSGLQNWGARTSDYQVFISLPEHVEAASVNTGLSSFVDKYFARDRESKWTAYLQPLKDLHFDRHFDIFPSHTTDKPTLRTLGMIGVFMLLMAVINFINLATAQTISRSKEVGVRKVLGSSRKGLIMRLLGETGVIVFISLLLALGLSFVSMPLLERIANVRESIPVFTPGTFVFLLIIQVMVTFMAGLYPAFVLSGFKPLLALKNKVNTATIGGVSIRWGLVIAQFVSLQILIIGTLVVLQQMKYVSGADLGFDKNSIVEIPLISGKNDSTRMVQLNSLRNQLLQVPGIQDASYSSAAPSSTRTNQTGFFVDHSPKDYGFDLYYKAADPDYFKVFHLRLLAGRFFDQGERQNGVVVNEMVARRLHLSDAASLVGRTIRLASWGDSDWVSIVGVVKDFNNGSLRDTVKPVILIQDENLYRQLDVKVGVGDLPNTIDRMREAWRATFPEHGFNYTFLDETIEQFYKQETQLALLYKVFTCLSIVIASIGLFALISFMAIRRLKEMSIRKVLGASTANIVYLFSKEYTVLIIFSFAISAPLAYLLVKNWLQHFAYRIQINPIVFILALVISLIVAWVTISYHAVKVAMVNPTKSLRSE